MKTLITKQILLAILDIEIRNVDRPYANISEISKESGISRPTIYKYLPILIQRKQVFEVEGGGRGTWVQSRYAKSARKTYDLMLKKEMELKQFIEQAPHEVNTADRNFPENLILVAFKNPAELDEKTLKELVWLKSTYNKYFHKVFSKHSNILIFAEKYSNLVSDLEETLKDWFTVICNKEWYLESKFLSFLQDAFPVLSKILCDVKALINTANFICDNQLLKKCSFFTEITKKIMQHDAVELDALFDSLDMSL